MHSRKSVRSVLHRVVVFRAHTEKFRITALLELTEGTPKVLLFTQRFYEIQRRRIPHFRPYSSILNHNDPIKLT